MAPPAFSAFAAICGQLNVYARFVGLSVFMLMTFNSFTQSITRIDRAELLGSSEARKFPQIITSDKLQILIDSIGNSDAPGHDFCKVYSESMRKIAEQMEGEDQSTIEFINRFILSFARSFIVEWTKEQQGNISTSSHWYALYSHPQAKPWQSIIVGVNAHINGDMLHSLIDNFTGEELIAKKKIFLSAQKSLNELYRSFFSEMETQSYAFRLLNRASLRIPELYGTWLVYKWRYRQVKLALLYFKDNKKFKRLQTRVNKKKDNIDRIVLSFD